MKKTFILVSVIALALCYLQLVIHTSVLAAEKKVIISYHDDPDDQDEDDIRAKGGRIKHRYRVIRAIAAEIDETKLDKIKQNPKVKYVEPDYEVYAISTPNDPDYYRLWGLNNTGQTGGTPDADIDATEAWSMFLPGEPSSDWVIAVIDTGVNYAHPDLAANMWTNPQEIAGDDGVDDDGNGYVDDIYGYDFFNNDNDPMDDHSHGSHCAGTIAGVGNNGTGVVGVNWGARIMALKFLSSGGSGSTSGAIEAIEFVIIAKSLGASIIAISNSWGGGGYSFALWNAIEAAKDSDILFIAAAGNYNDNNDINPFYPASYDNENVISVAATDHNDYLASFSHYGLESVDLGAPGVNIYSTVLGTSYSYKSGTSMATPHVAGAVGLVKAYFPGMIYSEVKDRILLSVDALPSLQGKTVSGGRLNVQNALDNDAIPPAQVIDLDAIAPITMTSVTLTWTATGDDGIGGGPASYYDIRYSTSSFDWATATQVIGEPAPQDPFLTETFTVTGLMPGASYEFAVQVIDNVGNRSPASSPVSGSTNAGTLLFHDDMESGTEKWVAGGNWGQTTDDSHSLATCWTDSPGGNYGNNEAYSLTMASPLNLTDSTDTILTFWHRYVIEYYWDNAYVEVSTTGNAGDWSIMEGYDDSSNWTSSSIDLSAYNGEPTLYIRFTLVTDISVVMDGWYIDDVAVWAEGINTPPAVPTGLAVSDPGTGGALDLSWNSQPDADGYNVYYNTAPNTHDTSVDVGNANTHQLTGLTNDTPYYISLTAYRGTPAQNSDHCPEVTGTPTSGTPTGADTLFIVKTESSDPPAYGSDDQYLQIAASSNADFKFNTTPIPEGANITSFVINVEHWEEKKFRGGVLLSIGKGLSGTSAQEIWGSANLPLHKNQQNEATDPWDVTDLINQQNRNISEMELRIQNNTKNAKLTNINYVYAEVSWGAEPVTPPGTVYVQNIDMSSSRRGKKDFWSASAAVLIYSNGIPVEAATVYGTWSGLINDSVSGTTGSDGTVVFTTGWVNVNGTGTFTFTVSNVVSNVGLYAPELNVMTSASIPVPSSTSEFVEELPTALVNAYPSPANPETWIPFTLSEAEHVVIRVYSATGRLVRTLDLGQKASGAYINKDKAAHWDGRNDNGEKISSGIYFYSLDAGSFRAMKKVIIIQ